MLLGLFKSTFERQNNLKSLILVFTADEIYFNNYVSLSGHIKLPLYEQLSDFGLFQIAIIHTQTFSTKISQFQKKHYRSLMFIL